MIQDYITGYLAGAVLLMVIGAVRDPMGEVVAYAIIGLAWPLAILFIAVAHLFKLMGWTFDFDWADNMFGARRATNPQVKGWAVTVLRIEFRLYKARKV